MEESNSGIPQEPVYSRKVIEMIAVANDFCMFLEKSDDYSGKELLEYLQKILPLIYIKASLLPDIVPSDEDAVEHYVTEEEWEALFNILRSKFGKNDLYYFIDNHETTNQDAIRASLSENITDLYQDLKDFLLLYQKPLKSFKENAVVDCKRMFETRSGYRLVNAHQAIHYLLFTEGEQGKSPAMSDL